MNNDDRVNTGKPANAPPTDAAGKPVNVVERDLQDSDSDTDGVDKTITPSSTRVKEQEVDELQRKTAEIERKVADGN
ncbi:MULTISPECIES: hypothetical protein [unclassified Pseudomonas]|uniref:hypothetical protein n=1 Tax=Pseudomonas sp. Ant30-3 TaxID=1488328 RepID=UPI00048F92D5|nr:hypothetical protein [Pseudomonas sp. Ant30-3]